MYSIHGHKLSVSLFRCRPRRCHELLQSHIIESYLQTNPIYSDMTERERLAAMLHDNKSPYHVTNLWRPPAHPVDIIRPVRITLIRTTTTERDYNRSPHTSHGNCDVIRSYIHPSGGLREQSTDVFGHHGYSFGINYHTQCNNYNHEKKNVPDVCQEGIYEPLNTDEYLPHVYRPNPEGVSQNTLL